MHTVMHISPSVNTFTDLTFCHMSHACPAWHIRGPGPDLPEATSDRALPAAHLPRMRPSTM